VALEDQVRLDQGMLVVVLAVAIAALLAFASVGYLLADLANRARIQAPSGPGEPDRGLLALGRDDGRRPVPVQVLELLVRAVNAVAPHVAAHSQRVAAAACAVARELGWDEQVISRLRLAALLHDLGRADLARGSAPDDGTLGPGAEDGEGHSVVGARILSPLPGCENIVPVLLYHHERYDGSGYPTGAAGESIPEAARLLAVADFYDLATAGSADGAGLPRREAVAALQERRGTALDPRFVDIFVRMARTGVVPHRRGRTLADMDAQRPPLLASVEGVDLVHMPGEAPADH
jgi:putative nucleotidyltransferase with HDIG domain